MRNHQLQSVVKLLSGLCEFNPERDEGFVRAPGLTSGTIPLTIGAVVVVFVLGEVQAHIDFVVQTAFACPKRN